MNLATAPNFLRTEEAQSPIAREAYVTLRHVGLTTIEGEQFRIVQRESNAPWGAARLERDRLSANFQGNPLWPRQVLRDSPNLLRSFGLQDNRDFDICVLPMTAKINATLDTLFPEPYHFSDARAEDDRAYVDGFIDHKHLPMAPVEERDSIHDWSYHFITLLFPEYLDGLRQNLLWIREHVVRFSDETNYAWNYYGHKVDDQGRMTSQNRREKLSHQSALYRQMAIALDVGSAKLVQLLMLQQRGQIEKCRNEIASVAVYLGHPNAQALRQILWLEPDLTRFPRLKTHRSTDLMIYLNRAVADLEKLKT